MNEVTIPKPEDATGPSPEFLARGRARMAAIDALPAETRVLVHEYGWSVVHQFLLSGITKPGRIKHLIGVVREGSAGFGNGSIHHERFIRDMAAQWLPHEVLAPREPSDAMIQSSMDAVPALQAGDRPYLTKWEKHRARLRAALKVLARPTPC